MRPEGRFVERDRYSTKTLLHKTVAGLVNSRVAHTFRILECMRPLEIAVTAYMPESGTYAPPADLQNRSALPFRGLLNPPQPQNPFDKTSHVS